MRDDYSQQRRSLTAPGRSPLPLTGAHWVRIRALPMARLLAGYRIAEEGKWTYQSFQPGIWRLSLLQKEGPSKSKDPDLNFGCGLLSPKPITRIMSLPNPTPQSQLKGIFTEPWKDSKIAVAATSHPASALESWSGSIYLPSFSSRTFVLEKIQFEIWNLQSCLVGVRMLPTLGPHTIQEAQRKACVWTPSCGLWD